MEESGAKEGRVVSGRCLCGLSSVDGKRSTGSEAAAPNAAVWDPKCPWNLVFAGEMTIASHWCIWRGWIGEKGGETGVAGARLRVQGACMVTVARVTPGCGESVALQTKMSGRSRFLQPEMDRRKWT